MTKSLFTSLVIFSCVAGIAYGATDGFTIGLQVGIDSTPPTTPTALTATPVAQTQIDLSWGASTDNFLLSGYQVFRDASQIATTTLTAYSDSGLTASTTYTYYVRAFDNSYNVSSSSNSVATTTLPVIATSTPTTTPTSNSSSGSLLSMKLLSFTSTPAEHSVALSWETNLYAQFELRWGRSSSYELGFVTNELFKKQHSTVISDLQAGTTYEFELIAFNRDGDRHILKKGQFKTVDAPDTTAPTNVSNLHATADGDNVLLTWDNPQDADFSNVRIVRSHLFYPNDPQDGFIAYVGKSNSLYDENALTQQSIQYYTVFSYDENGNVSSGAIVSVRKKTGADEEPISTDASTTPEFSFYFSDIEFTQDGVRVDGTDINIALPLKLGIAYETLPEHLKSIMVTFVHPDDKNSSFSFLLRVNKDKTYYEAFIAPLRVAGEYPVEIAVYDYQTQKLYSVKGILEAKKKGLIPQLGDTTEKFPTLLQMYVFGIFLFLFLLLLLLRIFKKRKNEDKGL